MKALNVANYIINKSIDFGKPISNLSLQKFMYFVHSIYEEDDDLDLSDYEFRIIDKCIRNLLELRPWELVDRKENSIAWILTYQDGVGNKREICDELIELQVYNENILKCKIVKEALNGIKKSVKRAVEAINNEIKNTEATNYKVSKFLSEQWEKNGLGNNRDQDREEAAYAHFLQSKNIQKAFENIGAAMYNAMKEFNEEKDPIQTKKSLKSRIAKIWKPKN